MSTREERKYPRFETKTRARVRMFGGPDWTEVTLVNISKGGACVVSPVSFARTSVIEIIINSPNPQIRLHNFMARVVWADGDRFGIQFMNRL